jgi:hypothetical protein
MGHPAMNAGGIPGLAKRRRTRGTRPLGKAFKVKDPTLSKKGYDGAPTVVLRILKVRRAPGHRDPYFKLLEKLICEGVYQSLLREG